MLPARVPAGGRRRPRGAALLPWGGHNSGPSRPGQRRHLPDLRVDRQGLEPGFPPEVVAVSPYFRVYIEYVFLWGPSERWEGWSVVWSVLVAVQLVAVQLVAVR